MNETQQKALNLFTYLKELCALRIKQIHDVNDYDEILWFENVPDATQCRCIAREMLQGRDSSGNDAEVWIEVQKPHIKSPPEVPDVLESWIVMEKLTDSLLEKPSIRERIPVDSPPDPETGEITTEIASLDDHEKIRERWASYLEHEWIPWAEEDRRLQEIQSAYNQLFKIYQLQDKLGEQYEVTVGIGLLSWKSSNSRDIRRHILTLRARVEFDSVRGIMSVVPGVDGPQPSLEIDMLETPDRPDVRDLKAIENAVTELDGEPWRKAQLDSLMSMFTNTVSTKGRYCAELSLRIPKAEDPTVSLSPAIILRKRTQRTLGSFYDHIVKQIEDSACIPENTRRLVEIVPEERPFDDDDDDIKETARRSPVSTGDDELYFPLKSNSEQKQIARIIEQQRGVLVQGPPGTGKSHTIANLIAHFLAKGQRILVTSETPRALEVLKEKIPPEIAELCVVWLGSDPTSRQSLEKSVDELTQRNIRWIPSAAEYIVSQLRERLASLREEKARLQHELRACRESDVFVHHQIFGDYSGTLEKIALRVNEESERFNWFGDRPPESATSAVTADELLSLHQAYRNISSDRIQELEQEFPKPQELLTAMDLTELVADESRKIACGQQLKPRRQYKGYTTLLTWEPSKLSNFVELIQQLISQMDALSKHIHPWVAKAAREIAGGQGRKWQELLTGTEKELAVISGNGQVSDSTEISGLSNRNHTKVRKDAKALRSHLKSGKGLGFGPFKSKVVKRCRYLIKEVLVDGRHCNSIRTLQQLIDWLTIQTVLHDLRDLWQPICAPPEGGKASQIAAYKDLCRSLLESLTIVETLNGPKQIVDSKPELSSPRWYIIEEVEALRDAARAAIAEKEAREATRHIDSYLHSLRPLRYCKNYHSVTGELVCAMENRDPGAYEKAYEQLQGLEADKTTWTAACVTNTKFHRSCPRTAEDFVQSPDDPDWKERFQNFDAAWKWGKAYRWLKKACDPERPIRLNVALEENRKGERKTLKELAAQLAWQHCMKKLGEEQRQALIAWSQAVARIRKGTGRHAEGHRQTARGKLNECRRAVPAWIMPLYQVVQTIKPQPDLFDIVIIDEASQSGPDALFLTYIGKKLIVVGDDKQIKPMNPGIDRDQVTYLRERHLREIRHSESLDLEGSLYGQAELRFPNRVRLREHFRCMPEIIQFSNSLSYSNEPLIPLRQYGADRLEPVKTVHVANGYRNGTRSPKIVNEPEAKAIVQQIADCCEDPRYNNKTFGVIALLGHAQSERIAKLLIQEIGAEEIERRKLICGKAYDFQGDERDIIFLSMVDAPGDNGLCRKVTDEDTQRRFNVAASRARDQLWLFHSPTLNDLRPECLKYELLQYCLKPNVGGQSRSDIDLDKLILLSNDSRQRDMQQAPEPFDSWFEVDVYIAIAGRGYRVLPQFHVSEHHRYIDLVVQGMQGWVAVECDGDQWHGPEDYEKDMRRQRELERIGWVFQRIRSSEFYLNRDEALQPLWELLKRRGITPESEWTTDHAESGRVVSESDNDIEDSSGVVEKKKEWHDETKRDDPAILVQAAELKTKDISSEGKAAQLAVDPNTVPSKNGEDRLAAALAYATRKKNRRIEDLTAYEIQNAILSILRSSPNGTSMIKAMTAGVLKELEIRTRGNPWAEFEKRVMRNIGALKRKGIVEEYKSKNRRLRLIDTQIQQILPQDDSGRNRDAALS